MESRYWTPSLHVSPSHRSMHQAVGMLPPSMRYSVPLMAAARGEVRKATSRRPPRVSTNVRADTSECIRDDLFAAFVIRAGPAGEPFYEFDRRVCLSPTRRQRAPFAVSSFDGLLLYVDSSALATA